MCFPRNTLLRSLSVEFELVRQSPTNHAPLNVIFVQLVEKLVARVDELATWNMQLATATRKNLDSIIPTSWCNSAVDLLMFDLRTRAFNMNKYTNDLLRAWTLSIGNFACE